MDNIKPSPIKIFSNNRIFSGVISSKNSGRMLFIHHPKLDQMYYIENLNQHPKWETMIMQETGHNKWTVFDLSDKPQEIKIIKGYTYYNLSNLFIYTMD